MPSLTAAQYSALKTDILANTATIPAGQPWTNSFAGVQVKDVPNTGDGNATVAGWYNQKASPDFFVWRSAVSRSEVYHTVSPDGTVWDWATFKGQTVPEQNSWTQMFMGDVAPFSNLSFRNGVFAVFSGSVPQNNQRAHIFAVGRRTALRIGKVLAVAPVSAGGVTVGPNNGNTTGSALGSAANPAVLGFEGVVTGDQIEAARAAV